MKYEKFYRNHFKKKKKKKNKKKKKKKIEFNIYY